MDTTKIGTWNEVILPDELRYIQSMVDSGDFSAEHVANLKTPPRYEFTQNDKFYSITKTSYEEVNNAWVYTSANFEMTLTEIEGQYWASFSQDLDNMPPRSGTIGLRSFLIEAHGMAKIEFDGDEMHIRFIKYEWFKEVLKKNRMRIDHELVGSGSSPRIILTASTTQLRSLMAKIAHVEEAFEDEFISLKKSD